MMNTQINITGTTIDAAITDETLALCAGCNITLPILTSTCEWC